MNSEIDSANAKRTRSDATGRYEVWYVTWNDELTGDGFWLRYTLEYPETSRTGQHEPHAEIWFARFSSQRPNETFGIHRRLPISTMTSDSTPFALRLAACELTSKSARGALAGGGHDIQWDLQWQPATKVHYQLPSLLYARGGLTQTTVLSPNVVVPLRGALTVDGKRYEFTGHPAGQTHLWGKKHAHSWAWGRCAQFVDAQDVWLETLSVRLMRRGVLLPPLTVLSLHMDGKDYFCNQFRHTLRNRATWQTGRYQFSAKHADGFISGEFTADTTRLINTPYTDPDGEEVFCANTEIGDLRLTLKTSDGKQARELISKGRAHFETGSQDRDPSVSNVHMLLL
jgi:hypothetical protein